MPPGPSAATPPSGPTPHPMNYVLYEPKTPNSGADWHAAWTYHAEPGGVDLHAPIGTNVYAPTNGTVRQLGNTSSAGLSLGFDHYGSGWQDRYEHLNDYAGLTDGAYVSRGTLIAHSGNSGAVTGGGNGAHLHRHLLHSGSTQRYNPWDYFTDKNPIAPEDDLPTPYVTTRTQQLSITTLLTWAQIDISSTTWQTLPYKDNFTAPSGTNLAEITAGATMYDVDVTLYVSSFTTANRILVRLSVWDMASGVISGLSAATFSGTSDGRSRLNYSMQANINPATTRLIVQVCALQSGAKIDAWRANMFTW